MLEGMKPEEIIIKGLRAQNRGGPKFDVNLGRAYLAELNSFIYKECYREAVRDCTEMYGECSKADVQDIIQDRVGSMDDVDYGGFF